MMYFAFRLSFAFLVSGTLWTVNSEKHSLNYIYTALSKPVDLPGIHEFTAMGLLDDRMIDYYDSTKQAKIPKQPWMQEKLDADYWEKGTQSRKSKEQWFKVNVGILMERMRQNNSDVHVLQWQHGCEIERLDGKDTFVRGFDQYRYDGEDFLAFDDKTMDWAAPNVYAVPTKRKWDGVEILNRYTKGYLEKECVEWLTKFETYSTDAVDKQLASKPPDVHVYAKKSLKTEGNVQLTCWATGFLPKEIELQIRKNEVNITKGVDQSGLRPNHDNTYQWWKRIEIPEGDKADYDCYVNHVALKEPPQIEKWDHKCADCNAGKWVAIGAAIASATIALVFGVVCFILYKKRCLKLSCPPSPTPSLSGSSLGSIVIEKTPLTDVKKSLDSGIESNSNNSAVTATTETTPLNSDKDDSGKESNSSASSQRSSDSQRSSEMV